MPAKKTNQTDPAVPKRRGNPSGLQDEQQGGDQGVDNDLKKTESKTDVGGYSNSGGEDNDDKEKKDPDIEASERANIKSWTQKIKSAKKRFELDFKRMSANMEFAAGLQWEGQEAFHGTRYVANITLRNISQKVSTLYARDPQAVSRRRERLNYQLWDGKMESLIAAMGAASQASQMMLPVPPEVMALMQDYQQGQQMEQMLDKVGQTLKILYHYQMDEQEPEFKEQLKQLVAYVCTCGIGYARMSFVRDMTTPIGSTAIGGDVMDRVKRIRGLTEKYEEKGMSSDSQITEQIRLLASSLISGLSDTTSMDSVQSEKIVWDFPNPLSIIVDPKCKALMGFIGAKWLAQEYLLPIDDVNAYFELRGDKMIMDGGEITKYDRTGKEMPIPTDGDNQNNDSESPMCCLWEIFNNVDKTRFFIVDGYKDYVQAPEALEPKTKRFWPLFGLTFNRIAVEDGQKVSIYPPSDVDLMKSMQKEWNATREDMREARVAGAPFYIVSKAAGLTPDDLTKIAAARPHEVIQLSSVQPGQDIRQLFMAMPTKPMEQMLYDTGPQLQDINLTIGTQAADLGQQRPGDTATGQNISEQARLSTTASNVDDLDGFLTRMARAGGEMLLREMSSDFVKKIVGPGAVWPETDDDKENFINALYLETEAASSGRPNQALEMKQWQVAAPVLQQAGANPQFMVRQTLKVLDSKIEPSEAFPLMPPAPAGQPAGKPSQPAESGGPQPQSNPGQQPANARNPQSNPAQL